MTENTTQAPTGLREARREQAQAQAKRTGAGTPTAGKRTGTGTAAKPAPKAAAAKPAAPKLRWQYDRETKMTTGQTAAFGEGELALLPSGDGWKAVYRVGKSETVLAEGSFGVAYNAAVRRSKEAA